MSTDVLLVGGVPLRPAAAVFETVARALGPLAPRIPDGDQHGWILAVTAALQGNPDLEPTRRVELSRGGTAMSMYRVAPGAGRVALGPYGFADVAARSYGDFVTLREAGVIGAGTRFQVTLPGPGTSAYMVELAPDELLVLAREALGREIDQLAATIPAADLTIQLDIAMEAEHEEYRRRPEAFDTPVHEAFDWTLEQMAESAAWLADRVPEGVELGFHICSIWHHYQPGGQDNAVLVDTVNAIAGRVRRPIGYVHLPTIPEHDAADFLPLRDLALGTGTRLYLGVIHQSDGLAGARRRIAAARASVADFGVASFCGLGNPAIAAGETGDLTVGDALHEDLRGGTVATLDAMLALHRDAAALA